MGTTELSRRFFIAATAGAATVSQGAAAGRLKAGLVGCGGRGTQAAVDILTGNPDVELTAMADVFEDKLEGSLNRLRDPQHIAKSVERGAQQANKIPATEELVSSITSRVSVQPDRHFTGFDAFSKLINSGVDIVMLCTPPGYRPMHFEAAVNAKKHVFTEKPIATDAVGTRRFMDAAKKAEEMKLSVVSGAQRHAHREYVETVEKIQNGAIGDIVALYSNYLSGPVFHAKGRNPNWGDMEWQHRNWYSFLWLCGDQIVEQHYHNIDFMNWVMGTHPVKVVASGGAAWRGKEELYGNIYDHMSSDFVYANGVHLSSHCRQYPPGQGIYRNVSDLIAGTKGRSNGMDMGTRDINPYVREHVKLVNSITGKGPYVNEAMQVAEATLTCIMGRESAYSGQEITWDMAIKSQQDLMPKAFDYKLEVDPPPVPVPGVYKFV
jgi:predicted dehydrogenase